VEDKETMKDLLAISDVSVEYGIVPILQRVSMNVRRSEILGIVGESGSGKSTTINAIMGILGNGGRITNGSILYDGIDLSKLSAEQMRRIRGSEIALISQNPVSSFHPLRKIGRQLRELVRCHDKMSYREAEDQMLELLSRMNLKDAKRILDSYAFEMSSGMCQRVSVAMAMVLRPGLLLADEPTSALDVTVQAQVVAELMKIRDDFGTSIVIVSHNMGVISHMADQMMVMYAGMVIDCGETAEIIRHPIHPYTQNLIHAIPKLGVPASRGIKTYTYDVTSGGCVFNSGCVYCRPKCTEEMPYLREIKNDRWVRCWFAQDGGY
jgi:oligopeptide/dipeptide ABC transporter ATP-binding protein